MKNHDRLAKPSVRQLEITINQVTRSLRRALRDAENQPLSPDLDLFAQSTEPIPFSVLANAAGPAWQAVQLRCGLLREVVEFSERVTRLLAALETETKIEIEPEPVPQSKTAPTDPDPSTAQLDHPRDPYELPHADDRDPMDIPLEELATMSLDQLAAVHEKMIAQLADRAISQGLITPGERGAVTSPLQEQIKAALCSTAT